MAVFNSFTFDNNNSLDYGIYITGEAVYDAPARVVEMITVPGKNGAIALDQGRFENIALTYPAGTFGSAQPEYASKMTSFRNMLASRYEYKRLEDTYNPDEFRLGLYKSGLDVSPTSMSRAGEFDIVFECKPQRFLKSGEVEHTLNVDGAISNPTEFPSQPLITVIGYGSLVISGRSLTVAGTSASQVINIDCETMDAWEMVGGVMVPRNDYIQNAGEAFPTLKPGANTIILGENMSEVKITPRWWRL